jgi:hypothetical protein
VKQFFTAHSLALLYLSPLASCALHLVPFSSYLIPNSALWLIIDVIGLNILLHKTMGRSPETKRTRLPGDYFFEPIALGSKTDVD